MASPLGITVIPEPLVAGLSTPDQDMGQKQGHDDGERAQRIGQARVQVPFGEQQEGSVVLVESPLCK